MPVKSGVKTVLKECADCLSQKAVPKDVLEMCGEQVGTGRSSQGARSEDMMELTEERMGALLSLNLAVCLRFVA